MYESHLRERAESLCSALVSGDIDRVTEDLSEELRHNLGLDGGCVRWEREERKDLAVERAPNSGFTVVLRLVGGGEELVVGLGGRTAMVARTIIEASHQSRAAAPEATSDGEPTTGAEDPEPAG